MDIKKLENASSSLNVKNFLHPGVFMQGCAENPRAMASHFFANMGSMPETQGNIGYLNQVLKAFAGELDLLVIELQHKDNRITIYSNIAAYSIVMGKHKFFDLILEAAPYLMVSRDFVHDNRPILIPLEAAVLVRKPHLVQTILSHPIFCGCAITNPGLYKCIVTNSLDLAKARFPESGKYEEAEIIKQLEEAILDR